MWKSLTILGVACRSRRRTSAAHRLIPGLLRGVRAAEDRGESRAMQLASHFLYSTPTAPRVPPNRGSKAGIRKDIESIPSPALACHVNISVSPAILQPRTFWWISLPLHTHSSAPTTHLPTPAPQTSDTARQDCGSAWPLTSPSRSGVEKLDPCIYMDLPLSYGLQFTLRSFWRPSESDEERSAGPEYRIHT